VSDDNGPVGTLHVPPFEREPLRRPQCGLPLRTPNGAVPRPELRVDPVHPGEREWLNLRPPQLPVRTRLARTGLERIRRQRTPASSTCLNADTIPSVAGVEELGRVVVATSCGNRPSDRGFLMAVGTTRRRSESPGLSDRYAWRTLWGRVSLWEALSWCLRRSIGPV
jgi:hypothetical protein